MKTSPKIRIFVKSVLCIWFTLTIGCASGPYYFPIVPVQFKMKPNMVAEMEFDQTVSIINNQPQQELVNIWVNGSHIHQGNLNAFTGVAISILKSEIERRGATVQKNSNRKLKLAVKNPSILNKVFWGTQFTLDLEVETGDGYKKMYTGVYKSAGGGLHRLCGAAILRAIAEVLNDKHIQVYLSAT